MEQCKCTEIKNLKNKKDNLSNVLERSNVFEARKRSCKDELKNIMNDSWNATRCESLKKDIVILPTMVDKLENTYKSLKSEINAGIEKIKKDISVLEEEDKKYHEELEKTTEEN